MTHDMSAPFPREERFSPWQKAFLFLTAALASTISLKVGSVQLLEILYFVQLGILLTVFAQNNFRTVLFRPFIQVGGFYLLFFLAAIALAIASLRFTFYLPMDTTFLRRPVVITISRAVEVSASVCTMIYMAHVFKASARKVRFAMRVYFWVGVASAIYSIVTWPLNVLFEAQLGTYLETHRFRGFYNEGGPYGVYVVSVLLVGFALWQRRWETRKALSVSLAVMVVAMVLSYSKAALLMLFVLVVIDGLLAGRAVHRAFFIIVFAVVAAVAIVTVDLPSRITAYGRTADRYERLSRLHYLDGNFVRGRVAGAFIVPRMIAAHPYTGIGWGNYGGLRNRPEFRGASVWSPYADDPGLGLIGAAADFGLPLLAYLLVSLAVPFVMIRRRGASLYLSNLALLQPLAHIFGAQLNTTFTWVVTAFALGMAYSDVKATDERVADTADLSPEQGQGTER
jgi:hypothetical protein